MSTSYYQQKPPCEGALDVAALPGFHADGRGDDTRALQAAINDVKTRLGYGVVLLPEGVYRISDTLYIPKAVRLIGYGACRPRIILGEHTPGFDREVPGDKGGFRYMVWFTDRLVEPDGPVQDAGPGTFYSALSNIDFEIGTGNPYAVALRCHFAQHSFVSHCDIHIGCGMAGVFDVGNEMEDVHFFGGEYGIISTKPSPGWPFLLIDSAFSGQRRACIEGREMGLTLCRVAFSDAPVAIQGREGYYEKLYMEDCSMEDIREAAFIIHCEENTLNQWNAWDIALEHVPVLAKFAQSGRVIQGLPGAYALRFFTHGVQMAGLGAEPSLRTDYALEPLNGLPAAIPSDIPTLPDMAIWQSVTALGAKGDGSTDDTQALQWAVDTHDILFFPAGVYVLSDTLRLRETSVLIGLHPFSTQLLLKENTERFNGPGPAIPLLETPKGGRNIVMGIGIDTGGRNPAACGCRWQGGPDSYMNDVKFLGGHGTLSQPGDPLGYVPSYNPERTADFDPAKRWDSQYTSLWVDGGGGVFKDIWTASPYACSGALISDTDVRGRIYAMSVEHHVRNEIEFRRVSNWRVLALQLEEEVAEGQNCQPLEVHGCRDMRFANLWFFRVIWLPNAYPYAALVSDNKNVEFLNVHNYTQVKYTINNTMLDINTRTEVRPWQLARFVLDGKAAPKAPYSGSVFQGGAELLFDGFEFADGLCCDSRGNAYFVDSRWQRIYRIDGETLALSLVRSVPLKPLSLFCDTQGNLLVVAEFSHPKGATRDGAPIHITKPDDARGTSYGGWYSADFYTIAYSIDPYDPEHTMELLERVPSADVTQVAQMLHPANRWRDNNDYLRSTVRPTAYCYRAPDGVTYIADYYDLIRSNGLLAAKPGGDFMAVDEYYKRVVRYHVDGQGFLHDAAVFAERGEYSVARQGNYVFIPDGELHVFHEDGAYVETLPVPQRPACVALGGQDGKTLFITARTGVYTARLK